MKKKGRKKNASDNDSSSNNNNRGSSKMMRAKVRSLLRKDRTLAASQTKTERELKQIDKKPESGGWLRNLKDKGRSNNSKTLRYNSK